MLNRNIGCIEILPADDCSVDSLVLNRNIGCIEIFYKIFYA